VRVAVPQADGPALILSHNFLVIRHRLDKLILINNRFARGTTCSRKGCVLILGRSLLLFITDIASLLGS
jgi:hypothetical protein